MTAPRSIPCSVLVLTRNSAATIGRCLHNLAPFGEILVHDANSTDDTQAIAKSFGAKILKQEDTDEPAVRIKNFTDMRFKQRDAAAFDWVLYLDSDEELSDGLVEEIGRILPHADVKTIVKVRRLPVIDGRVRKYGLRTPEIVPRIHHRRSGCTFKTGKVVHEKYVYDESFTEVLCKEPLLFPLPAFSDLLAKDDGYVAMDTAKRREAGIRFGWYLRWVLLREPLLLLSLLFRMVVRLPLYLRRDSVPFAYDWRYVRYHWKLLKAMTTAMFA
ncbi:MAG: glycosyltransferase [Candidatus Peribacteraceae bacterium]|jgi:glycosyltransferase involved in cell wall biosynthesis